jgi:protein phosphatase
MTGQPENENVPAAEEGQDNAVVVRVFGRTDVGLVREHNEDNFLIADLTGGNRSIKPEVRTHTVGNRGSLFAVCDGMGGAAAGEVASRISVDTIYEMMQDGEDPPDDEALARRLDAAIHEAGTRIYTAARLNRGQRGMGTTVTAAVLVGPRLLVGQVGDSRAHIVRQGQLVQVTKDQSLVQQLIDAKQLTEEEAKSFDKSNIILQALGTTEEVHVDMTSVLLRRGDALVMCSDGLSGLVEQDDIRDVLLEVDDPMEACRRLTDMACDMGGDDNITVVVARFDGGGLPEPGESDELCYERFEYPKVGEITVRSAYPKDPSAKDEPAQEQQAEAEPEPEAEPEAETAAESPAEEPSEQAAAEAEPETVDEAAQSEAPEEAAEEAAEPVAAAEEPAAEEDVDLAPKGKAGKLIAMLAIVVVGGIIGAYFAMRGAADDGQPGASGMVPPGSPAPAVQAPAEPVAEKAGIAPGLDPSAVELPALAPIDEEDILGKGKKPKAAKANMADAAAAEPPEPESPPAEPPAAENPYDEPGSKPVGEASNKKKSGKKKSGKKKKKKSLIPDNPFE